MSAEQNDSSPQDAARAAAERRRRLAEIFGDVLPDRTTDERGGRDSNDEQLRRDVPPHH